MQKHPHEEWVMTFGVNVEVMYDGDPFTVARASITDSETGKVFTGEGVAKRCYLDQQNKMLAAEIAKGRAIKALMDKLDHKKPIRHPRHFVEILKG